MSVSTQSIREIVADHPSAATVFQRFDIDLCSQGEKSLDAACAQLQLSVDQVLEKLEEADRRENGGSAVDPDRLTTERLIQHIVRTHHQYARQVLPSFVEMARKLAVKHGEQRPELREIAKLVESLQTDMLAHIQKEEQILFPYVSQLAQGLPVVHSPAGACFDSVVQPVRMMKREHEAAGQLLQELRRLIDEFDVPTWACGTHAALLAGLRVFEADLKRHFHLEDNILFPRAIELETEIAKGVSHGNHR